MSLKTKLLWTFIISFINMGSEAIWDWNRHDYVQDARPGSDYVQDARLGQISGYFSAPTEPSVPKLDQPPFQLIGQSQPQQTGYVNVPNQFYPACECERYCFDIPQIHAFALCSDVYEFLACINDNKYDFMGLKQFCEQNCGNCGRYKPRPDYSRPGIKPDEYNQPINGGYNIRPPIPMETYEVNNKAEYSKPESNKEEFNTRYRNNQQFRPPVTVKFAKPYKAFQDEQTGNAPVNLSEPDPSPRPQ